MGAFSDERLVQVMEKNKDGKGYSLSTFRVSSVERVRDAGEGHSVMVLVSGFEIPVVLPPDVLKQKIYRPDFKNDDMELLDLTTVTGKAARPAVPEIGEWVEGEGVYLGQYKPKDRDGKFLSKTFNIFAAPEDLPETMTYADAVKYIAKLKKRHGFDGTNYPTDKEIYAALKDGSYKGGWIIPTRELLVGTEPDGELGVRKGKVIQSDNLFDHQNKGAFKGTFKTAAASGSGCPGCYWSSTEGRDDSSFVLGVRFSDGNGDWLHKDIVRLSCRPVRLVEASVSGPGVG